MANNRQLTLRERMTRVETKLEDGFNNLGGKLDTYIAEDRKAGGLREERIRITENKLSTMNGASKGASKFITMALLILAGLGGVLGVWAAIIK